MDRIITVSRQFGSGGRMIASMIAEAFNIPAYDKEIIARAAEDSGIAVEQFEKTDEKRGGFLFSLVSSHYGASAPIDVGTYVLGDHSLFLRTAEAVKRLASKPCVIVGRCADDILKDLNPLRLFVCAPAEARVKRVAERYGITEKAALSLIKKTDKSRSSYYSFYTDKTWGDPSNYDICLNTSAYSLEKAVSLIKNLLS